MAEERETLWGREQMVRSEVRERADELAEDVYPEDTLHEIIDGSVPIYTSDLMDIAADNIDMATLEPEIGPAFDGSSTPVNIVAGNIFDALTVAAYDEWAKIKDETDDH